MFCVAGHEGCADGSRACESAGQGILRSNYAQSLPTCCHWLQELLLRAERTDLSSLHDEPSTELVYHGLVYSISYPICIQ